MSTRKTCDMTAGAQGPLPVPNVKDWGCEPAAWDEDGQQVNVRVDFYLAGLLKPHTIIATVSNTTSTKLSRNPAPTGFEDLILVGSVDTPSGYTSAINGWRGGANKNARQKGLADALLAAGIVDASLGGSTS